MKLLIILYFLIYICSTHAPRRRGSYGNKLSYGDLVCNDIYTYPGWPKSLFYVEICKIKICDCVDTIPNLNVKAWSHKNYLTQGNHLNY